jgi:hypothetical protein
MIIMPNGEYKLLYVLIIAVWAMATYVLWWVTSQPTCPHAPPISTYMYLESTSSTSFIYFIRIFTVLSQYWCTHSNLTIYSIEAYAGNTTVDCVVKPQLPITIGYNYMYGSERPVTTLVLYCPTPISSITVKTNNGTYS